MSTGMKVAVGLFASGVVGIIVAAIAESNRDNLWRNGANAAWVALWMAAIWLAVAAS